MLKHVIGAVLVVGFVLPSSPAFAQANDRCRVDDVLQTTSLMRGRNAWARKCGYLSPARESSLNEGYEYLIFSNACSSYPYYPTTSTCQAFAPVSENDPCVTGFIKLGSCVN